MLSPKQKFGGPVTLVSTGSGPHASMDRVEEERALKYAAWLAQRRALEGDWRRAAAMKAVRDEAEACDRTADPGIPVHEQCSRYRRCAQCRRRLDNSGETNVWADSSYIPGTRYIV